MLDTPGWINNYIFTCDGYQDKGWCADGKLYPLVAHIVGNAKFNFPEYNCVACGKTRDSKTCNKLDTINTWVNNQNALQTVLGNNMGLGQQLACHGKCTEHANTNNTNGVCAWKNDYGGVCWFFQPNGNELEAQSYSTTYPGQTRNDYFASNCSAQ